MPISDVEQKRVDKIFEISNDLHEILKHRLSNCSDLKDRTISSSNAVAISFLLMVLWRNIHVGGKDVDIDACLNTIISQIKDGFYKVMAHRVVDR